MDFCITYTYRSSYPNILYMFVILVCLGVFVPLETFSRIWRRHHDRWRVANFDLCSALIAFDQWGYTYCDTRHPFVMVISKDPWHSHLLSCVWQWSCPYLFNELDLSRLGLEHPTFCLRGERSNPLRPQWLSKIILQRITYIWNKNVFLAYNNLLNNLLVLLWDRVSY